MEEAELDGGPLERGGAGQVGSPGRAFWAGSIEAAEGKSESVSSEPTHPEEDTGRGHAGWDWLGGRRPRSRG